MIKDDLIYDFLNNGLLMENDIYKKCDYILEQYPMVDTEDMDGSKALIPSIDSIFTNEDLTFIRKQYENGIYFKLESTKIKNKNLISLETYNRISNNLEINKEIPKNIPCISYIRVPIFNLKKDMVVIYVNYNCGLLCGEAGVFVYKKNVKEEWKLYLTLKRVVS